MKKFLLFVVAYGCLTLHLNAIKVTVVNTDVDEKTYKAVHIGLRIKYPEDKNSSHGFWLPTPPRKTTETTDYELTHCMYPTTRTDCAKDIDVRGGIFTATDQFDAVASFTPNWTNLDANGTVRITLAMDPATNLPTGTIVSPSGY